jgi:hypothetical protein
MMMFELQDKYFEKSATHSTSDTIHNAGSSSHGVSTPKCCKSWLVCILEANQTFGVSAP